MVSMSEADSVPKSHMVLNASIGECLLAITAMLDITIEKTAATKGAAIAKPILLRENLLEIRLLMPHLSSQNLIVPE
jgi:hypothetical protein